MIFVVFGDRTVTIRDGLTSLTGERPVLEMTGSFRHCDFRSAAQVIGLGITNVNSPQKVFPHVVSKLSLINVYFVKTVGQTGLKMTVLTKTAKFDTFAALSKTEVITRS